MYYCFNVTLHQKPICVIFRCVILSQSLPFHTCNYFDTYTHQSVLEDHFLFTIAKKQIYTVSCTPLRFLPFAEFYAEDRAMYSHQGISMQTRSMPMPPHQPDIELMCQGHGRQRFFNRITTVSVYMADSGLVLYNHLLLILMLIHTKILLDGDSTSTIKVLRGFIGRIKL